MLDVGTNFMWPDTMALTAEMMVDKDPQTYAGKASRRPPQSLMPTRDGHGVGGRERREASGVEVRVQHQQSSSNRKTVFTADFT